MAEYIVPLPDDEHITIDGPFPVTLAQWAAFLAVLDAMKPGLVQDGEMPAPLPGGSNA